MATYAEMVQKVLDWSNRDIEVLSVNVITDALRFAADEAYRKLKIPALEAIYTYEVSGENSELSIPGNLTEIIQLRRVDPNSLTGYVVYGAKSDVRSFYNEFTFKYDDFFFTREQNKLIYCPETTGSETFQLYYYGRQPAVDARYSIDTDDTDTASIYQYVASSVADVQALLDSEVVGTDVPNPSTTIREIKGNLFAAGKPAPNWLRDENERILLFGALAECFDFLMEQDQSQVFRAKFYNEIDMLNEEDKMRMSRGGNINTHFIAPLI